MRDVAVVAFAQSRHVAKDREHNEVETIIPVVQEAVRASGIPRQEIGFTISGSCDYLSGGPFTFVAGLDAVGAWPPIKESHVEMDGAWALYEAWVALQIGDVDSALIYSFGKSSQPDLHEIISLQTDPYLSLPLWPSMVDMAALQASAWMAETDADERVLAEVVARSRRAGLDNPDALVSGAVAVDELLAAPVTHHPLRDHDLPPITDGAAAVVLAAGDLARELVDRPAWIRGIDHRIEGPALGARDLARSPSTTLAAARAGVADGPVDLAEVHAQFSHEEPILRAALGLGDDVPVNPSGGPLCANPYMSTGLIRIGESARRVSSGAATRAVAHASQGPCLQQNLVCVLEGE